MNDRASSALVRVARALQRTPGEAARLLLEEKLRQEEFAFIEFRATASGRLAYVRGTRLAVWQVALIGRDLDMDATRVAELLELRAEPIASALAYAQAYPEEVDPLVEHAENVTLEGLQRVLPWVRPG